ncbi:MAG TPA: hypothetical protein VL492_02685, partial [Methylovirgula sp.]|nr:hypothetical protein [Methylovirgula sp.]
DKSIIAMQGFFESLRRTDLSKTYRGLSHGGFISPDWSCVDGVALRVRGIWSRAGIGLVDRFGC